MESIQKPPLLVAMICALGVGAVMFDQTSLVIAAPAIVDDLDSGLSGLQWLTAIFPLVAASTMPVSGTLGQRWGARTTMRLGLAMLMVGGAAATFSASLAVLLAARIVQGIGAALILPNAVTLLGSNIHDPTTRARSVGHWMTASTSALLLGPIASGVLTEQVGWRSTFAVNIPLALLAFALLGRLSETSRTRTEKVDILGLTLACGALAAVAWTLIAAGRENPEWTWVGLAGAGATALIAVFALVEKTVANPLLDLAVFKLRKVRLILLASLIYNAAINGTAILLSVFFQGPRGFSATMAGSLLLITNTGMPIAGTLVNKLRARWNSLQLLIAGLGMLSFAYLALGIGSDFSPWLLPLPLISIGLGAGILYFVDTHTVMELSRGPELAGAMASLALMRQIGSVLGIAAMALLGQIAVGIKLSSNAEPGALLISGIALAIMSSVAGWHRSRRGPKKSSPH